MNVHKNSFIFADIKLQMNVMYKHPFISQHDVRRIVQEEGFFDESIIRYIKQSVTRWLIQIFLK